MVQSSCCCFPETIKNTAVRNTVALSHMCLPYCEHTLIPHTLMKDHRKILSQSNQSQTNEINQYQSVTGVISSLTTWL